MVAGKFIYNAIYHSQSECPRPPPMPTRGVKVKIFVEDMKSVLECSISETYGSHQEKKGDNGVLVLTRKGQVPLSPSDLRKVALRPTKTKETDMMQMAVVNQSPLCVNLKIQQSKLKHAY